MKREPRVERRIPVESNHQPVRRLGGRVTRLSRIKSNELSEESVIRKFRITATDGKNYETNFYNLDAIISVGYRVNSYQATQFRRWATTVLKSYLIKGFALDDERLKQGKQVFLNAKTRSVFRPAGFRE